MDNIADSSIKISAWSELFSKSRMFGEFFMKMKPETSDWKNAQICTTFISKLIKSRILSDNGSPTSLIFLMVKPIKII